MSSVSEQELLKPLEAIAGRVLTPEEIRSRYPALWTVINEHQDVAEAMTRIVSLVRHPDHHHPGLYARHIRRATSLITIATLILMVVVTASFTLFQRSDDAIIRRVYQAVGPAVVAIDAGSEVGSGVVFDRRGYILTNYHVVDSAHGNQVQIALMDATLLPASIVGVDPATDLAVLKIDMPPEALTVARFGEMSGVQVGDLAVAIGNPFDIGNSVTVGHISAVSRTLHSPTSPGDTIPVFQTDAAINPGNSGGPLLNTAGEIIGINTAVFSTNAGGIAFAIRADVARRVAEAIVQDSLQ